MEGLLRAAGWDIHHGEVIGGAFTLSTPWLAADPLAERVIPGLIDGLCPCCTTWAWTLGLRFDGVRRNGTFGPVVATSHSLRVGREGAHRDDAQE